MLSKLILPCFLSQLFPVVRTFFFCPRCLALSPFLQSCCRRFLLPFVVSLFDCSDCLSCSGEFQDPLFSVLLSNCCSMSFSLLNDAENKSTSSANRKFVRQSHVSLLWRMPSLSSCHLVKSSFSAYSAGLPVWILFLSRTRHSPCPSRQTLFGSMYLCSMS